MKKWKYLFGIFILGAVVYLCQSIGNRMLHVLEVDADASKQLQEEQVIVIDAGHGSFDPGKVGINDILEKDVNLSIAKKLKKLLEEEKITVVMTRDTDDTLAGSKVEDLRKRVEMMNQNAPILAVSIHQNSYTSEEVKGAQVFYYPNSAEGKVAAEMIQESLRILDPDNKRLSKANQDYYLLKKTEIPLTIVECGFLSNREEAEKLSTDSYQQKIAEAICSGIMTYLEESKRLSRE